MNKEKIKRIFLMLLPMIAVGIAISPNSVWIMEAGSEQIKACSYFALLPEGTFQMSTVLAGIIASLSGGLSFTYFVAKKKGLIKPIMFLSMASATFAVAPVLLKTATKVLPNVGVPILLVAHTVVAFYVGRGQEKEPEVKKLKPRSHGGSL